MKLYTPILCLLLFSCKATQHSVDAKALSSLVEDTSSPTNTSELTPEPEVLPRVMMMRSPRVQNTEPQQPDPPFDPYTTPVGFAPTAPGSKVDKKASPTGDPEISFGGLVYEIPDTMRLGKTYLIRVRIERETGKTNITADLGKVHSAMIKTTSSMQVELVDPSPADKKRFDISSNNSEVQMVEGSEWTEWSFNVTPLRGGSTQLHLVVSIIKGDLKKQIVYRDAVLVQTDVKVVAGNFWNKYWQWLFTTFLIPLFLWWKNRKKKKEDKP